MALRSGSAAEVVAAGDAAGGAGVAAKAEEVRAARARKLRTFKVRGLDKQDSLGELEQVAT
jgi:hypothetical protein